MSKKSKTAITSLDQLTEWVRNPRSIGPHELEGLKQTIEKFGDLSGIVWNTRLRALVSGHQRVRSIKERWGNKAKVEGNVIKLPNGKQFPIRLVDWDEQTHAAANIAANNPHVAGKFTKELASLMEELERQSPEMMKELNFDSLQAEMKSLWDKETPGEEIGINVQEAYGVIVMCANEKEQEEVYKKLVSEGYQCKVVVV